MKPKWLFEQVASHPLEGYWVVWVDKNILENVNTSNLLAICSAGFDVQPFQNWKQFLTYMNKCAANEFLKKEVIVLCEPEQREEVKAGIDALKTK